MQFQLLESKLGNKYDCFRCVAVARAGLVDPVTDGCALQRTAHNVVEIYFACQRAVDKHAEGVTAAKLAVAVAHGATISKCFSAVRRVGGVAGHEGLPFGEPTCVANANLAEGFKILRDERTQHDAF